MKNHMRLYKCGLVSVTCLLILFGMVACRRLPAESSPSDLHTSLTTAIAADGTEEKPLNGTTVTTAEEDSLDSGAANTTNGKSSSGTTVTTSTTAEEDSLDFGAADTTTTKVTTTAKVTTTTKVTTATKSTAATKSDTTAATKTNATDWYGKDEGYTPMVPW